MNREKARIAWLKAQLAKTRDPWWREQIENELDRIAEHQHEERKR